MLNIIENLLPYLLIIISFNTALFLISCFKKDNSIVDIFYSWLFMISTLSAFVYNSFIKITPSTNYNLNIYSFILTALILIWGIRLSSRIYDKNKNKPEDFRYAAWRTLWLKKGKLYFYLRSYAQIFLLQGILAFLIVSPVLYFINKLDIVII